MCFSLIFNREGDKNVMNFEYNCLSKKLMMGTAMGKKRLTHPYKEKECKGDTIKQEMHLEDGKVDGRVMPGLFTSLYHWRYRREKILIG